MHHSARLACHVMVLIEIGYKTPGVLCGGRNPLNQHNYNTALFALNSHSRNPHCKKDLVIVIS